MIKKIFYGKVTNGRLELNDRESFEKQLLAFNGEVQLTIDKKKKQRTSGQPWEKSNQNGYFHGVVLPILCESTGQLDAKQMKHDLKRMFLRIGGTAKIQNEEGRFLPTEWKVAKKRGIEEDKWRLALGYPPIHVEVGQQKIC